MFKQFTCYFAMLFLAFSLGAQQIHVTHQTHDHEGTGIDKCHTMEMDQMLRNKFPEIGTLSDFEEWLEPRVRAYKRDVAEGRNARMVLTVPIIFHIIHNGEAVGSGTNIAATFVNAQLVQLNNDFRKILGTSGYNTNPVGADTELQFCAALVDPNGNVLAEPGINRINRNTQGWSTPPYSDTYIDATIKPQSIWDPTDYVNVWVMSLGGGLLGYAQFPNMSGVGGLPSDNGPAETDGVVVLYNSVGSSTVPFPGGSPYDLGRTLTHELGHFFGLLHTFQGGCGASNDFCDDTPKVASPSFGCPTGRTTCSGSVAMIENYMDYSDDACMNIFTLDQKARIQAVMANSPRRMELTSSTACSVSMACATCPLISAVSFTTGCDDQNTCFPIDDVYPTTFTLTHQSCASETGDGQFSVVFDPSGDNIVFGPFNYSTGTTTEVQIYTPYGAVTGDEVGVYDNDFSCGFTYPNTFNPSPLPGCSNYALPVVNCPPTWNACPGSSIEPATTGTATAQDCDGNALTVSHSDLEIGVGLSPGESVIQRTWTSAPDVMGNTGTCIQIINRDDATPPTVTTGSIGTCYPTVEAAEAAALAATSATDNCPGALTETTSTVGNCSATIMVTTADAYGNSATTAYNTRIDNADPMVTQGMIAACYPTVAAAEAAALAATSATDNCSGLLTETVSTEGTCSATITVTTTDGCGNSATTTYNTRIDNTPPTLVCLTNTVFLAPSGTYTLQTADVLNTASSFDNCGAYTVTGISPASVDCSQFGTVVPVTVTAVDECGNTSSCVANITVLKGAALPPPYVNNEVGTLGQTPGAAVYDPCEQIFTVTSTGFSTTISDDVHYAYQTICGNISITARVLSVQNGYGGIMLRETLMPGAKKTGLKATPSITTSIIREIRSVTNGAELQSYLPIPMGHTWLRLTRNGNVFQGLTSPNGVNWTLRFTTTIMAENCLLVGFFAEAYNVNDIATVDFGPVSIVGSTPIIGSPGTFENAMFYFGSKLETIQFYPNPTNGLVTADLSDLIGQNLNISILNTLGKTVWIRDVDQVVESTETIDLSGQVSGIYWVRIQTADGTTVTRRLVLAK